MLLYWPLHTHTHTHTHAHVRHIKRARARRHYVCPMFKTSTHTHTHTRAQTHTYGGAGSVAHAPQQLTVSDCCLQEALLSAEIALGCAIEQGVVEGATEALVTAAEERVSRVSETMSAMAHTHTHTHTRARAQAHSHTHTYTPVRLSTCFWIARGGRSMSLCVCLCVSQVVLTWRYGGLTAAVAGDLVGSWSARMPLMRCKNPSGCKGTVQRGECAEHRSTAQYTHSTRTRAQPAGGHAATTDLHVAVEAAHGHVLSPQRTYAYVL